MASSGLSTHVTYQLNTNEIEIQLNRLKRRFEECYSAHDEVSLYDLSHSLRVIAEMKRTLGGVISPKSLIHLSPPRKFKRSLTKPELYYFLPFPGILSGMSHFSLVAGGTVTLGNPEKWKRKRMDLIDWLGVDCFYFKARGGVPRTITRERLIKRIANVFGASHPMTNAEAFEKEEDSNLRELMKIEVRDRPIPYWMLMTIAKQILVAADFVAESDTDGYPDDAPQAGS